MLKSIYSSMVKFSGRSTAAGVFAALFFCLSGGILGQSTPASPNAQLVDEQAAATRDIAQLSDAAVLPTIIVDNTVYALLRTSGAPVRREITQDANVSYGIYRGWLAITRKFSAEQEQLVVISTQTREEHTALRSEKIVQVSWSPQGDRLAVVFRRGGGTHLAVYSLKERTVKDALDFGPSPRFVIWSFDGGTLYYRPEQSAQRGFLAYDLASGKEIGLSTEPRFAQSAQYSAAAGNHDPGPADGLTVLDNIDGTNDVNYYRTPLILVHGINEGSVDSHYALATTIWNSFITAYNNDITLKNKYKLYRYIYESNQQPVWQLARSLRNHLDEAIHSNGINDVPFLILAHSMGGLVSRSYMSQHSHYEGSSWMAG